MIGEVRAVGLHGSVAVLYLVEPNGDELAVACDPRMARDIEAAIRYGERPIVEYQDWQVIWPASPLPAEVAILGARPS